MQFANPQTPPPPIETVEAIGYVGFAISHNHTDQLLPYILQSVFILVAPALFAATVYMILGRLIVRVPSGASCSLIRPSWLTKTFVIGDVILLPPAGQRRRHDGHGGGRPTWARPSSSSGSRRRSPCLASSSS